jgi:sulfhydrogenase subunit beta (sulfur reductase)
MSDPRVLAPASLDTLFAELAREGVRVIAPRRRGDRVELGEVRSPAEVGPGYVPSGVPAKAVVFPKVETILQYRGAGREVAVFDPPRRPRPTVVWGVRPCEARAFGALGTVLDWDTKDAFFDARMEATTFVAAACTEADEACFCTSVGGAPDDAQGSDVLLRPLAGGGWAAEAHTAKGRVLLAHAGELPALGDAPFAPTARLSPAFDAAALREALVRRFDDPVWAEQSLRCLGCGACAYTCPTCHCFDIVDEGGTSGGTRVRNWDACQFAMFTLHASGHNPRAHQWQRQRQRIYHKFHIYPQKFGTTLCTGCGNCARNCPAGLGVLPLLTAICHAEHL